MSVKCPLCQRLFYDKYALAQHTEKDHDEEEVDVTYVVPAKSKRSLMPIELL